MCKNFLGLFIIPKLHLNCVLKCIDTYAYVFLIINNRLSVLCNTRVEATFSTKLSLKKWSFFNTLKIKIWYILHINFSKHLRKNYIFIDFADSTTDTFKLVEY